MDSGFGGVKLYIDTKRKRGRSNGQRDVRRVSKGKRTSIPADTISEGNDHISYRNLTYMNENKFLLFP